MMGSPQAENTVLWGTFLCHHVFYVWPTDVNSIIEIFVSCEILLLVTPQYSSAINMFGVSKRLAWWDVKIGYSIEITYKCVCRHLELQRSAAADLDSTRSDLHDRQRNHDEEAQVLKEQLQEKVFLSLWVCIPHTTSFYFKAYLQLCLLPFQMSSL